MQSITENNGCPCGSLSVQCCILIGIWKTPEPIPHRKSERQWLTKRLSTKFQSSIWHRTNSLSYRTLFRVLAKGRPLTHCTSSRREGTQTERDSTDTHESHGVKSISIVSNIATRLFFYLSRGYISHGCPTFEQSLILADETRRLHSPVEAFGLDGDEMLGH